MNTDVRVHFLRRHERSGTKLVDQPSPLEPQRLSQRIQVLINTLMDTSTLQEMNSSSERISAFRDYEASNSNSNNQERSFADQFQKMSAAYEKAKSEMDDMQFNASLDALLDGENMNDEGQSGSNDAYSTGSLSMMNSNQSAQAGQGHLTSEALGMQGNAYAGHNSYQGLMSYGSMGCQQNMFSQHQSVEYGPSGDSMSVSSSTLSARSKTPSTRSRRHARDVSAVSEDEEERVRRRQDRNVREQQRSQKITQQIDHLKDVLAAASVPFKPDKYSTLVTVAEYIQQLQERSALLDVEHKKLVDTISRTNELVNDQYMPASTTGANPPGTTNLEGTERSDDSMYIPNVDYKTLFSRCGVPLAVLSIDGRFLECNHGFERLTGYTREELLPCEMAMADTPLSSSDMQPVDDTHTQPPAPRNMSLFNILSREHMEAVFMAMSEMLRQAPDKVLEDPDIKAKDFWSGVVCLARDMSIKVRP